MKRAVIFVAALLVWGGAAYCQSGNLEIRIFKIKHGNVESMQDLANTLKSPEGKVSADRNTNSLIVLDYPENLARIAKVIEQLDMPLKQVEIKVLVTELSDSIMRDIGLSAAQVIIPSGKFSVVSNLINSSKEVNIRSQMSLKTLSSYPASLQVSKDEIFGTTVTRYSDGREVTSVIREPVGDFLQVLPTVNSDGTITVALMPTISSVGEDKSLQERTILTQVVINNGDTIALGGVSEARSESGRGWLSSSDSRRDRRVVMFLTAKIIE